MKKTTTASNSNKAHYFENGRALRELSNMKHRDLQRACIVRGMPSQDMVESDHHKLVSWFIENYDNTQSEELLINHDGWVEEQLIARGYKKGDVLLSPALRFSYVGNIEEIEKPKIIKPHNEKEKPPNERKEKSTVDASTGIRTGTKKALTYQLTISGLSIGEVIKGVKNKFPEAEDKSIKIWFKRATNLEKPQ
jgi:hypothetical protein